MRSRALSGLPAGDSRMALIPDPPMSMESVTGCAARAARPARLTRVEARGAGTAVGTGFSFITIEF